MSLSDDISELSKAINELSKTIEYQVHILELLRYIETKLKNLEKGEM